MGHLLMSQRLWHSSVAGCSGVLAEIAGMLLWYDVREVDKKSNFDTLDYGQIKCQLEQIFGM